MSAAAESTDTSAAAPSGGLAASAAVPVPIEEASLHLAALLCEEALRQDPTIKKDIKAFTAVVDVCGRMDAKLADTFAKTLIAGPPGGDHPLFGTALDIGPALQARLLAARSAVARDRFTKVQNIVREWSDHVDAAVAGGKVVSEASRWWLARLRRRLEALEVLGRHTTCVDGDVILQLRREDMPSGSGDGDLVRGLTDDDLLAAAAALYAKGHLTFPWKRLYIGCPDTMMATLRRHTYTTSEERCEPHNVRFFSQAPDGRGPLFPLRFEGGYLSFVHDAGDYDAMDVIVDSFQEGPRLKAKRNNRLTTAPLL